MRTKDTDIMSIFDKKPIERRGVSTPEKPLRKIPVNPDFEVPPEVSDEMCLSGGSGDPFAPFPYKVNIGDERADIYSGDGRIMASLFIENFSCHKEMVSVAMLMSKAPEFCKAAEIALRDLGRFHNGIKKSQVDVEPYDKQRALYGRAFNDIYDHIPSGTRELYEPIYPKDTSMIIDESEIPEEISQHVACGWVMPKKPRR